MEWRKESSRDWEALIRAGLLLALSSWIVKLLASGELKWYVNPKFTYFTASATIGLSLMAWGQLVRAFERPASGGGRFRWRLYLALAAVLALGFWLKPVVFSADLAAKQGMNLSRRTGAPGSPGEAPGSPGPAPGSSAPAPGPSAPAPGPSAPAPGPSAPAPGPSAPAPTAPAVPPPDLVIGAKNFVSTMNEIYFKPEPFAGKRAAIEGFTFHPPDTSAEEFAVIRLVVTCHVAHAAPDGLLVMVPGTPKPPQDQWVRAEGVLELVDHNGTRTVRLRVDRITPVPQPEDPYVYP